MDAPAVQSIRRRILALALALFAAALAGCGFHLRGHVPLNADYRNIYIQAAQPGGELVRELRRALKRGGAKLVGDPAQADLVLRVGPERSERRVLSVDENGKVREFELHYSVEVGAYDPAGTELLPPEDVGLVRDFLFDENLVLGKATEQSLLLAEMRRDAVGRILYRLRALETPPPAAQS